ncbi:MAG: glycoside hydrolase family 65 protein [Candidatus Aureabacteria bacterium]|nr:glycoside hydrolase family 65 protein [Candidatus Auribacterota bacterium]
MREKKQDCWKIVYNSFDPEKESLREALCAVGNGYFVSRGAVPESSASEIHYPGTYMAGVYNRIPSHIAGRTIYNEDLVNCPNWLCLTFRVGDDEWFCPSSTTILFYRQELDMQGSTLTRLMRVKNWKGQITTIKTVLFVHMEHPHLGFMRYCITPENYSEILSVRTMIDGSVRNTGVERYRKLNSKHLVIQKKGLFSPSGIYLSAQTSRYKIKISLASKTGLLCGKKKLAPRIQNFSSNETIGQELVFKAEKNRTYTALKTAALFTSNDDVSHPLDAAIRLVRKTHGFKNHLASHHRRWKRLWDKVDIQIAGNAFSQKALRFHVFHLLQTASPNTVKLDVGIPPRGLHGEAYRGHIFWDEIFILPFYDLHFPDITKTALLYRHRRLPAARRYARENGYSGAMFPWQSGMRGQEETQVIHLNPLSGKWGPDHSRTQRHVSLAIAYNVWEHFKRTSDVNFLRSWGAEIILSISQFFATLVSYDPFDGRYHTSGIMGPDEFHERLPSRPNEGLKDNAYTNIMIAWLLRRAVELIEILPDREKKRILKKLKCKTSDLEKWNDIAHKMAVYMNKDGIVSQFDGYFSLKEIDWNKYRKKYRDLHRMDRILKAEGRSPDDYKISKQADFLMLFYLLPLSEVKEIFQQLGYPFSREHLKKNYEYYLKRTSHGSTLSRVVHCFIADIIGRRDEAWKYYIDVLESDLHDTQGGTTPEGIHTGVMGGSLDIALRGFAGINTLKDRIHVYPSLPKNWRKMRFKFCYRKKWISVSVTNSFFSFLIHGRKNESFPVPIQICGKLHYCVQGRRYKVKISKPFVR